MKKALLLLIGVLYCGLVQGQTNKDTAALPHITDSLAHYDTLFSHYRYTDLPAALEYSFAGLHLAQARRDSNQIGRFLGLIAISYKNLARYDSAIAHYQQAIELDSLRGNRLEMCGNIANKGFAHKLRGEYIEALDCYLRALSLLTEADTPHIRITILNNIGNLYADQNAYEQAESYYLRSLELAKASKTLNSIGYAYNNLGNVFFAQKQYDEALRHFNNSIKAKKETGDRRGEASSYGNIGRVFLERGGLDSALHYLHTAEAILIEVKDHANLGEVYLYLGDIALLQGKESEGVALYERSLQAAQTQGRRPLSDRLYLRLSEHYGKKKQYEKAFYFGQQYHRLHDSLTSVEHVKQINNLQFNAREKENRLTIDNLQQTNQIQELRAEQQANAMRLLIGGLIFAAILLIAAFFFYRSKQHHNEQLQDKNAQIASALQQKELLLREIHHRVKNNLQIIASLLNLQRNSQKSPETLLQQSQERIYTMSVLHEKLYQSEDVGSIDLQDYILHLVGQLRQAYQTSGDLKLRIDIEPVQLNIDTLTPCGLILNEIITNVFKYAFPQPTPNDEAAIIGRNIEGKSYELRISDNGIGLPAGFNISRARSLGLRLIQGLSRQMQAELTIQERQPTEFILRFPVASNTAI